MHGVGTQVQKKNITRYAVKNSKKKKITMGQCDATKWNYCYHPGVHYFCSVILFLINHSNFPSITFKKKFLFMNGTYL